MAGQVCYTRGHNGGNPALSPDGNISYTFLECWGQGPWTPIAGNVQNVVPVAGTFDYLRVKINNSTGAGHSLTFSLNVNGVDTALSTTITNATTGNDTTHSVAVNPGDVVCMSVNPTGTPNAPGQERWVLRFTAAFAGQSIVLAGGSNPPLTNTTVYQTIQGEGPLLSTESLITAVMPTAGTFRSLYVNQQIAADVGRTTTYTLMVNGVPSALTCNLPNTTSGNDTTNAVAVNAGDLVSWQIITQNVTVGSRFGIGVEFDPVIEGESVVMIGSTNQGQNTTLYTSITGSASAAVSETVRDQLMINSTLTKLHASVSGPIASGQTDTITVRKNASSTALALIATGDGVSTISGTDGAHTVGVLDNDLVDFQSVTSATSGTVRTSISLVIYQPTAFTPGKQYRALLGVGI